MRYSEIEFGLRLGRQPQLWSALVKKSCGGKLMHTWGEVTAKLSLDHLLLIWLEGEIITSDADA
jgi:hypothetical protein